MFLILSWKVRWRYQQGRLSRKVLGAGVGNILLVCRGAGEMQVQVMQGGCHSDRRMWSDPMTSFVLRLLI